MSEKEGINIPSISITTERREIVFRWEKSNIPEEYKKFRWKNYQVDADLQKTGLVTPAVIRTRQEALFRTHAFAKNITENVEKGRSLLYIGGKSTGKTMLGCLVLREIINKLAEEVLFVSYPDILGECSKDYENEGIVEFYSEPKVLLIDEVEEINTTEWFRRDISQILTRRRFHHRMTIITSKMDLDQIQKYWGKPAANILEDRNYFDKEILIASSGFSMGSALWRGNFSWDYSSLMKRLRSLKLSGKKITTAQLSEELNNLYNEEYSNVDGTDNVVPGKK